MHEKVRKKTKSVIQREDKFPEYSGKVRGATVTSGQFKAAMGVTSVAVAIMLILAGQQLYNICHTEHSNPYFYPADIDSANWFNAITSWDQSLPDAVEHNDLQYGTSSVEWFVGESGGISHVYLNPNGNYVNGDINESVLGGDRASIPVLQNIHGGVWSSSQAELLFINDNESLKKEFAKVGKDGVVIDMEGMTLKQKEDYHNFLKRVNDVYEGQVWAALPAKIIVNGNCNDIAQGLDYKEIANNVDKIVYMTMDENPGNRDIPVASPGFISNSLDSILTEGVSSEKVVMVLPTYIKFTASDAEGKPIYNTPVDQPFNQPVSWFQHTLRITEINEKTGEFKGTFEYWENGVQKEGKILKGWYPTGEYIKNIISIALKKGVHKFYAWDGDMPNETYKAIEEMV
jgi:hypothetical protein